MNYGKAIQSRNGKNGWRWNLGAARVQLKGQPAELQGLVVDYLDDTDGGRRVLVREDAAVTGYSAGTVMVDRDSWIGIDDAVARLLGLIITDAEGRKNSARPGHTAATRAALLTEARRLLAETSLDKQAVVDDLEDPNEGTLDRVKVAAANAP